MHFYQESYRYNPSKIDVISCDRVDELAEQGVMEIYVMEDEAPLIREGVDRLIKTGRFTEVPCDRKDHIALSLNESYCGIRY